MTGRAVKLYTSPDQEAPTPFGFFLAPPAQWRELATISADLRHDWYEVILMPRHVLTARLFSAHVIQMAKAGVMDLVRRVEERMPKGKGAGFAFPLLPMMADPIPPPPPTVAQPARWVTVVPGIASALVTPTDPARRYLWYD